MLEVTELSGGYHNNLVLDSISFQVNKGEFFGISRSKWEWKNNAFKHDERGPRLSKSVPLK